MTTKPFDPSKPYRLRDGRNARVYVRGVGANSYIHGAVQQEGDEWTVFSWPSSGSIYGHTESGCDLVNILERRVLHGWFNVYSNGRTDSLHETKHSADVAAKMHGTRIACVEITQEYEV